MKTNRVATLGISALSMIILILDGKTALASATGGIDMCLRAVIPSLFPFFFLSVIINDRLLGANSKLLRPLSRLCKIPKGSESIVVLGLIGGYPVGAASIYDAYKANALSKAQATRMLSFCNNAGPAFLFGILAPIFDDTVILWALWAIQILSALAVGMLLPGKEEDRISLSHIPSVTPARAMQMAIRNIACVCGWIILFKIVLGFFTRWFFWLLPQTVQILLIGLMELSNGCLSLTALPCAGMRFLFAAVFLSFGGICVCMQTASVIGDLPLKSYIVGKILQVSITVIVAGIAQAFLFPKDSLNITVFLPFSIVILFAILLLKKAVAFRGNIGYNVRKSLHERGALCCFEEK